MVSGFGPPEHSGVSALRQTGCAHWHEIDWNPTVDKGPLLNDNNYLLPQNKTIRAKEAPGRDRIFSEGVISPSCHLASPWLKMPRWRSPLDVRSVMELYGFDPCPRSMGSDLLEIRRCLNRHAAGPSMHYAGYLPACSLRSLVWEHMEA